MMFILGLLMGFFIGMIFVFYMEWRIIENDNRGSHYKVIFRDKNIDEVI